MGAYRRHATSVWVSIALSACVGASGPPGSTRLDTLALGEAVTARVLENEPGCVVDAVCFLTLEFSDTVVVAIYGSGERPAPCPIDVAVSDAAFALDPGVVTGVTVDSCDGEGLILEGVH